MATAATARTSGTRVATKPGADANANSGPLTVESLIMALPPSQAPDAVMTLSLADRRITSMPDKLAFLKNLRKLDLSNNAIANASPLSKLVNLSQLKIGNNRLDSLQSLTALKKLSVLDVSNNAITSLDGVAAMPMLVALIAPSNKISNVDALAGCKTLETLVLSRNPLDSKSLAAVNAIAPTLRKLSASQCGLEELPVLDLPLVNELRLNGNSLREFPEGTALRSLKILDVANNKLDTLFSMRPFAVFIQQLSVHGNPVSSDENESDAALAETAGVTPIAIRRIIGHMFKSIKILDGKPYVAPSSQELREDRARRALGVPSAPLDGATTTKAAAIAGSSSAGARRALQLPVPEPVDVVYTGDVPAAPETKTYIKKLKSHRSEAAAPLAADSMKRVGGPDVAKPAASAAKGAAAAPTGATVIKGSALLEALQEPDAAGGW